MGDRSCSSRAQEGVENEVAGVRGYGEDAFDEALGFRSGENIVVEEFSNFFLGFVGVPYFFVRPEVGRETTFDVGEVDFSGNAAEAVFGEVENRPMTIG